MRPDLKPELITIRRDESTGAQYIDISIRQDGQNLEYQLKFEEEGLVLDAVTHQFEQAGNTKHLVVGLESIACVQYSEHPDYEP